MGMRGATSTVLMLLAATGCAPPATAAFDAHGYHHLTYNYRVGGIFAADPNVAPQNLLGNDWKLDNFKVDPESDSIVQKDSKPYLTEYEFDVNDDNVTDGKKQDFLFDLRFNHLERDAIVWLRTFPISSDEGRKQLRVLMDRYVNRVSGPEVESVRVNRDHVTIRVSRYSARVLDRGRFKVAGRDAYVATFDIANVDELTLNPKARQRRVRLVIVRAGFSYPYLPPSTVGGPEVSYPVLMVAGYSSSPEDFATDEKDFMKLLETIRIGKDWGTTAIQPDPLPDASATSSAAQSGATPTPTAAPVPPPAP
jgi:hypothetical protein